VPQLLLQLQVLQIRQRSLSQLPQLTAPSETICPCFRLTGCPWPELGCRPSRLVRRHIHVGHWGKPQVCQAVLHGWPPRRVVLYHAGE